MKQQTDHLVHESLEARDLPHKHGKGLFAVKSIVKDTMLLALGGRVVTRETLEIQPEHAKSLAFQVGDDIYLLQSSYEEGDCINHCCDANAGFFGQIIVVAMRDIKAGEEICYDYAMTDTTDYDEFECHCGSKNCRKHVTGNDWKLLEVQKKYQGYFSPHVQRLIDQSKTA